MDGPHGGTATRVPDAPGPHDGTAAAPRRAPWVGVEPPLGQVLAAGSVALLAAAFVEILLLRTIGPLTAVVLVAVAVGTALTVRPRDLFTAGVLPPMLLVALLLVVAVAYPGGIRVDELDPSAGLAQRVVAGFVDLAGALVVAHALALVLVALRVRATRLQRLRSDELAARTALAPRRRL